MTLYLRLYWEFFKTGLFAIGGGMATLPFLKDIGATTGWFSQTDLMNMLAVSESTPGPVGINMATYVGYMVGGVPGAIVATIGEVTPSIIVILIVAAMLAKFRDSQYVANAFYGLRPASTGLIGAACAGVMLQVITGITSASQEDSILMKFSWDGAISWRGIILALVLLVFTRYIKKTKDLHPTRAEREVFFQRTRRRKNGFQFILRLWTPGQPLAALPPYGCRVPLAGKTLRGFFNRCVSRRRRCGWRCAA